MSVLSSIKDFFSPKKSSIDFRPSLFRDRDKLSAELHDEMFHDNGTFDEQMNKMMARIDGPPSKVPSLPSGVVSSGFTASTLKQALDDAKAVRATALKNAQQALASAFDIHGVKPAPSVYKPGFKITVHDDVDDIGDFDEDLDMSMGLSGFNLNNNQYNSITLTGSIPAPSIQYVGLPQPNNARIDVSMSDPIPPRKAPVSLGKDFYGKIDDKYKNGLPQPPFGKVFYDEFFEKKDDGSGAVDKQPEIRTGKIARVEFDVVFGRPQWSNQIHAIKNSLGKEIYLASNHGIVRAAVSNFNEKLKEMYGDKVPVFTIEGGTMFRTGLIDEAHPILSFRGLRFPNNGAKITAVFSYDCELNRKTDIEAIKKDIELIGSSCQFFVLGELELTEDEESITDMVFESFGYNNPHRMNINKELFRIL